VAAILTGRLAAHSCVRTRTPERPAIRPSQVAALSPPSGVVAPIPVTTTVRLVAFTGTLYPLVGGCAPPPPPGGDVALAELRNRPGRGENHARDAGPVAPVQSWCLTM